MLDALMLLLLVMTMLDARWGWSRGGRVEEEARAVVMGADGWAAEKNAENSGAAWCGGGTGVRALASPGLDWVELAGPERPGSAWLAGFGCPDCPGSAWLARFGSPERLGSV